MMTSTRRLGKRARYRDCWLICIIVAIIFRNLGRPVSLSKYTAPTSASIIEPLNSTTNNSSIHPLDYENVKITEADLLMSACLWHEGKSQHISYKSLFGSWDYITANRSDHESLNLATKVTPSFAIVTRVDDEHEVTIENITSVLNVSKPSPIMFFPSSPNPAHCVQDVLFSVLPLAYRGDLNGVHAVTTLFSDDYCSIVITALGWFEEFRLVPDYACFDKLWVPAFMHYRFPRGRSRGVYFKNGNGYLHEEDLPIEMLLFFQKEMWKGLLTNNNTLLDAGKHKRIVFETRRGTGRRIWKNADEVVALVRQKVGPNLDVRIVDNVGALSVQEQAEMFHSASVLVAPHSGSNA